ncbi:hypothetical protein ABIF68_001641 [Bradyrhizobium japonicum]
MSIARNACSFYLSRLRGELSRLIEATYPGYHPGPKIWLDVIVGLVETAQGYLALIDKRPADEMKLLVDAEVLGEQAYAGLSLISGADASQIPHQIVDPFQRWVAALKITNTIFFRAEHVSNYELARIDCRTMAQNLNAPSASLLSAIGAAKWPILRVTVPSQAMGMLPHFAVVAHELGHAIQDNINLNVAPFQAPFLDCIKRVTSRLKPLGFTYGLQENLLLRETLQNWVNEFKADAVGHILVGPAFFFALFGFLELAGRSYGLGKTHPPSDLRRKQLVRELNDGAQSFQSVMQGCAITPLVADYAPNVPNCPLKDTLFNEITKSCGEVQAAICVELIELFDVMAPAIFAAARKYLTIVSPELVYTPAHLSKDVQLHLKPLRSLIPPIEFQEAGSWKPTSLATILNVGWIALLELRDEHAGASVAIPSSETAPKMEQLHELLLKAVELSEARRLWEENR